MIAATVARSQVDHFIDVIENPALAENGVHHEWRRHTANGQSVRTDRSIDMIRSLSPSTTVHVLHHNGRISGNIFLEKRKDGFGPDVPDTTGRASFNDGNGFPLEERSLRKSDANDEEIEQ